MIVQRRRALATRAWVKYSIIALCAAVFLWELALAGAREALASYWLVPGEFLARLGSAELLRPGTYLPFLTSTFLHDNARHLLFNMIFLEAFGDDVEDRLGHAGFAAFFALGGALAAAAHVAAHPQSALPIIGASGAIAAVMGFFLVLQPLARLRVLFVPLRAPAFVLLAPWFALQLAGASTPGANPSAGSTAWWAHCGGFAYGMGVALWLRLRRRRRPRRAARAAPRGEPRPAPRRRRARRRAG